MGLVIVARTVKAVRYTKDVLEEHVVPNAIVVGPGFLFV